MQIIFEGNIEKTVEWRCLNGSAKENYVYVILEHLNMR